MLVYTPDEHCRQLTTGPATARTWSTALRATLGELVNAGWQTLGFTRQSAYHLAPAGDLR